jgi:CRISPR-associated Csx14 family protein
MKLSVIAPIGTSPPVVTEFVQYVEDALGERISDLTVICTSDPYIICCTDLAEEAVLDKYPHIHFHRHQLGFEDIDSQDKLRDFMLNMAELMRDQVVEFKADKIYVNSAGGRKDALIALSMICQFLPVSGIFHIVMPDVKAFNVGLERAKVYIEEFGKTNDKRQHYLNNKNTFEPLMYPHPSTYSVIKIPVVPFPPEALKKVADALEGKVEVRRLRLDLGHLMMLVKIGLATYDGRFLYPTDEGRFILRLLRTVY